MGDLKGVSFFLTLINIILARPEKPIQAFVSPCEVWALHGEYVKDYSESIQTHFFNYSCVEQERCERSDNSKFVALSEKLNFNTTEIDMRGAIFNLDEDMEAANNAECSKPGEICCPGKFVQPPPLECPSRTGEIKCVDRLIILLSDHNHQIMDEKKIKRTKTLEGFLRKACELTEDFSLLEIHNFLGKLSTDSSAIHQKDRDVPCCESEFCRKLTGRYFYFEKKTLSYEDAKQNCI